MEICLIAVFEETSRVMGIGGRLIWKIKKDMERFVSLTRGQVVIMGRRTYESIGGRPLPDRFNIVVSRTDFFVPGGAVTRSIASAIRLAKGVPCERICFIGGEWIFEEAMQYADTFYLTLVSDQKAKGDVYFPAYGGFGIIASEEKLEEKDVRFRFITIKRKAATP